MTVTQCHSLFSSRFCLLFISLQCFQAEFFFIVHLRVIVVTWRRISPIRDTYLPFLKLDLLCVLFNFIQTTGYRSLSFFNLMYNGDCFLSIYVMILCFYNYIIIHYMSILYSTSYTVDGHLVCSHFLLF